VSRNGVRGKGDTAENPTVVIPGLTRDLTFLAAFAANSEHEGSGVPAFAGMTDRDFAEV
jgi:hypothetical protein